MSSKAVTIAALVIVVVAGLSIAQLTDRRSNSPSITPFALLQASNEQTFSRVETPWDFRFPADHGSHSDYRTEWWHVTGVLQDDARNRLGMQLILMRLGLMADATARKSPWATTEIYAGIFSISDPAGGPLLVDKRTTRAALDLAGATIEPVRVWLEDWHMIEIGNDERTVDLKIQVASRDLSLEIELRHSQPLVDANQIRGYNVRQKAPFQFYVQPRLTARGTLKVGREAINVTGIFAMEHAWGELPLPGGPVAQDRFIMHLNDKRVLLCLRMHGIDASVTAATTCTIINPDGHPIVIPNTEVTLIPTSVWASERTNARYPTHWTLRIPREGVNLQLEPYWQNQAGSAWLPFWAGPVKLDDATAASAGDGFVQLHGYTE